jgi:hypothetical protein
VVTSAGWNVPAAHCRTESAGGQASTAGSQTQEIQGLGCRGQADADQYEAVQYVVWWWIDRRLYPIHDRSRGEVSWVTFEVAGGGLVALQLRHIVAIYDEQGSVKLATTAGGVHVLKDTTVQRAAMVVSAAADAAETRSE